MDFGLSHRTLTNDVQFATTWYRDIDVIVEFNYFVQLEKIAPLGQWHHAWNTGSAKMFNSAHHDSISHYTSNYELTWSTWELRTNGNVSQKATATPHNTSDRRRQQEKQEPNTTFLQPLPIFLNYWVMLIQLGKLEWVWSKSRYIYIRAV